MRRALLFLQLLSGTMAAAADWTQWRGPTRDGISSETGLPSSWTVNGVGQVWRASTFRSNASPSAHTDSSPAIAGGKVYLRNSVVSSTSSRIIAFRESDGTFLWEELSTVYGGDGFNFCPDNQGASSPAVSSGLVCDCTKEGRMECFSAAANVANRLWVRELQTEFNVSIHNCADGSPIFYGNLLVFHTSAGRNSTATAPKLVALYAADGGTAWTANPNQVVNHGSWASPIIVRVNNQDQLVYAAGNAWVYGVDLQTRATVWSFNTGTANGGPTSHGLLSTPIFYKDTILVASGEDPSHGDGPGTLWAIDATRTGDISATGAKWRYTAIRRSISSPLAVNDVLYTADIAGNFHAVDFTNGQTLFTQNLGAPVWASPTYGDGKIYIGTNAGDFYILSAGRTFQQLDRDNLGYSIHSSASIANGRVYIASARDLFAIGSAPVPDAGSGCGAGRTNCGGSCVDTATDSSHCGGCGSACGLNQVCSGGSCTCGASLTRCGSACVDTRSDDRHCGGCNRPCAADRDCVAGSCTCIFGRTACGTECVDPRTDARHCGACNRPCAATEVCDLGNCTSSCSAGLTACGQSCVDLLHDEANCGACGKGCALPGADPACESGRCVILRCQPDFYDLDLDPATGCEYGCTWLGQEACNAKDDDCNGRVDEDGVCAADAGTAGCPGSADCPADCDGGPCVASPSSSPQRCGCGVAGGALAALLLAVGGLARRRW
ncbi:MAG: PQQ-binding-like beta-propeller repeat protein [Myxococcales bacterium]|nr:PQQ-binding-like beta-propeller repeat protein [Myxococcales bacterium]